MKLLIYGMSMERQKAKNRIISFQSEITENIIKLGIYQDNNRDRNHWIDELATWFSDINDLDLKPKGSKFNRNQYDEWVFGEFGTDISDVRSCIHSWQLKNRKTKKYPDVYVDDDTIEYTFMILSRMRLYFLRLFPSKNIKTREDILDKLHQII